jgi:hypothetical protein
LFGKITKFHGSALVEAEIIASVLPETMPLVSDGIDNLGSSYTLAPGSVMIVTGTDKRYILGTDSTWEEMPDVGSEVDEIKAVIPESATAANKLATASDISGENISGSASSTALSVTDAADSRILGISIRGRSSVTGGSIVSVGDNGLTVTTENSDSSQSTSAAFSQSLPVRGIDSDTYDEIIYHGDRQQIVRRCGLVTLSQCTYWRLYEFTEGVKLFGGFITAGCKRAVSGAIGFPCVCDSYTSSLIDPRKMPDKCISVGGNFKGSTMPHPSIVVRDDGYSDVESFLADNGNVTVLFPYSDAAVTSASVSSAEAAALRGLRTFAGTTSVSATDAPIIALEYIRNTDNGKAVEAMFDTQQSQIDNHEQRIADLEDAVAELGGV